MQLEQFLADIQAVCDRYGVVLAPTIDPGIGVFNRSQYQSTLKPDDFVNLSELQGSTLDLLAAEYHRRTEEYDRTVCTGPVINGSIQPLTPAELGLVNRNAAKVFDEIAERAAACAFTRAELRKAVGRAS
jgi:hypothetical protein